MGSTAPTTLKGRGERTVKIGISVLVVLTTTAVALVSIWWMPVYLTLVVAIFATPQRQQPPGRRSEHDTEKVDGLSVLFRHASFGNRKDQGDQHDVTTKALPGQLTGGLVPQSVSTHFPLADDGVTKSRRGRARIRKTGKATIEPKLVDPSVTWVRVGPGKFVRADSNAMVIDNGPIENFSAGTDPVADAPVEVLPASLVNMASNLPDLAETSRYGNEAANTLAIGLDLEMEEYSITPSAFCPNLLSMHAVEGLTLDASEMAVTHQADSSSIADLHADISGHGEKRRRLISEQSRSASQEGRLFRETTSSIPSSGRAYLRRNARKGPQWTLIRGTARSDPHLTQAVDRTFGRLRQVQRSLRPRSPPNR